MPEIEVKDIERIEGPFYTKKMEFMYQDWFPVKEGKKYNIFYTKQKTKRYVQVLGYKLLIPFKDESLFQRYTKLKSRKREIYLKPYNITIKRGDVSKGIVKRAFAQYILDTDNVIFEIDPSRADENPLFYKIVKFDWKLTGKREQVREVNEFVLKQANEELNGIEFLLNPLEFYVSEVIEESRFEKVQKKLSYLKY